MARPAHAISDDTPLDGAQIDIAARIGWLMRSWRGVSGTGLRDLRTRLAESGAPASLASLSRHETHGIRSSQLLAGYEAALGLPPGRMRTPIDILCRTFAYAPEDVGPIVPSDRLEDFSSACAIVDAGGCTGFDWLELARFHADGRFGLPEPAARPLVERLAREMPRATGLAYANRYEALARLRCSAYADLVADVIRELVDERGAQRLPDLLSVVTELPTREMVEWCAELVQDRSADRVRAACAGIQNLRSVGGLATSDWNPLPAALANALNEHRDDTARTEILIATFASCPSAVRRRVAPLLEQPLPRGRRPSSWSSDDRNRHYALCVDLARSITGQGPAGDPMLARLLFEVLFDFRSAVVVTSCFVLAGSPYAEAVRDVVHDLALTADEATRRGAARVFADLMLSFDAVDPEPWLASPDPMVARAGLVVSGFAAHRLPEDRLHDLLTRGDDSLGRDALFAAGMAEHPALRRFAGDDRLPVALRDGAAWWARSGGRIDL